MSSREKHQTTLSKDYKLKQIINKYYLTLSLIKSLNKELNSANVSNAINKAKILLNKYRNYTSVKSFYIELTKLKNELNQENKTNYKLENLLSYIEDFLMKLQTGDVVPLTMTTQTKYGNLIQKIITSARGKKSRKSKKTKIRKSKTQKSKKSKTRKIKKY